MKKYLIILFCFITVSVNFSVFAYEIGDFINIFQENPAKNVGVTVKGTAEEEKNKKTKEILLGEEKEILPDEEKSKKVKEILLGILENRDGQDLFNHVSLLTGTIKQVEYASCCWYASGILAVFDLSRLLHLIPDPPDKGLIIKINTVSLNEQNYSFLINIEEFCAYEKIELVLGCRSKTRNPTYQGKKLSSLLQGKKSQTLKTLYSL